MADQTLELLVKLRADVAAGFDSINNGLNSVKKTAASTQQEVGKFSEKLATMAGAVDLVSKKMASLGEAAGLPVGPLRAISDVADLGEIGFKNLTKGMAGFNAASVGVAGVGLAVGSAIGAWLNTFPAVQHAVDSLRDSLIALVAADPSDEMAQAMHGMAAFQKQMGEANAQAFDTVKNRLLAQGKTIEEIAALYNGKLTPAIRTSADMANKLADEHKKAVEAAKKAAQEQQQALESYHDFLKKKAEESAKFQMEWTVKGWEVEKERLDDLKRRGAEAAAANIARFKEQLDAQEKGHKEFEDTMKAWEEEDKKIAEDEQKRQEERRQGWIDTAGAIAGAVDELAGLLQAFGVSAESDLGKAVMAMQDFAHAGEAAAASIANFASGNILGGIGAGLNALGGLVKGIKGALFGGQEEHKKVNDMRDAFVSAAGGLDQLNKKAHEAGLTLDHMLQAKTVKDYQAAILELENAMNLQADSTKAVDEAMQRWGISIGEMGPKFAQQELDKQAAQLIQDYKMLTAAGADQNLVLEKMAGGVNEYVNASIKAGTAIPEAMRPVIEQMIANGELLDENGVAFGSVEEAGISFAQTMSEQFETLIEKIDRMVNALLGINNIDVSPHVTIPDGGGGAHGGGQAEHFAGGGMVTGWGVPSVLHGTPDAPEYVLKSNQLKELMQSAMAAASAGNGGSGPPVVVMPQINLDGAVVSRGVTRRQDMGYGRTKRRTRRV